MSGEWMGPYPTEAAWDRAMFNRTIERLLAWKAEAMTVLAEWEKVWELAGRPGPLGRSKAANIGDFIDDLVRSRRPDRSGGDIMIRFEHGDWVIIPGNGTPAFFVGYLYESDTNGNDAIIQWPGGRYATFSAVNSTHLTLTEAPTRNRNDP